MSQIGKQILGLFFIIGLLLSACDQEEAATNTPTPIPLAQQPTATIEPTITASSTPTATSTSHSKATPTLQPTNTPTVQPTPTSTTDPNPFPEVPITSFSAEDYQLRPPNPDLFLDVLEMALRYNRSSQTSSPNEHGSIIWQGNRAFSQFLAADLDNHFPEGLPTANQIIDDKTFASDLYIVYPDLPLQKVLRTALLVHIKQNGFLSTDDFDFIQIPIELDDTFQPAWLVEVNVPRFGLQEWIPFYLDEENNYEVIDNDLVPAFNFFDTRAEVTHDLTGDGLPEILLIQEDYLLAGQYGGYFSIHTWDGNRLRRLDHIGFRAFTGNGSVEQEIGDFDEDGREEIRIVQHHYAKFGCSWDEISVYQWQGLELRHETTGSEIPESPLCNTARAMSFGSSLSTDERIRLLEEVLQGLSIDTAPSVDFLALIRIRLAVLYASKGMDEDARRVLTGIDALPGESGFVRFVNTHSEMAGESLVALCDSMYEAVGIPPSSRLGTDIDNDISIGGYPIDGSPSPIAVCPLSWLISERMKFGQYPLNEDVEKSFASLAGCRKSDL